MAVEGLFDESLFDTVMFNEGLQVSDVFVIDARFDQHGFDEVLFDAGPPAGIPTVKPNWGVEVIR